MVESWEFSWESRHNEPPKRWFEAFHNCSPGLSWEFSLCFSVNSIQIVDGQQSTENDGNHGEREREKNKGSWKNINQSSSQEFSINFPAAQQHYENFNSFQIFYFPLRHSSLSPLTMVFLDENFAPVLPGRAPFIFTFHNFNRVKRESWFSFTRPPSTLSQWRVFPHWQNAFNRNRRLFDSNQFWQFIKKTWEIDQLDRNTIAIDFHRAANSVGVSLKVSENGGKSTSIARAGSKSFAIFHHLVARASKLFAVCSSQQKKREKIKLHLM